MKNPIIYNISIILSVIVGISLALNLALWVFLQDRSEMTNYYYEISIQRKKDIGSLQKSIDSLQKELSHYKFIDSLLNRVK